DSYPPCPKDLWRDSPKVKPLRFAPLRKGGSGRNPPKQTGLKSDSVGILAPLGPLGRGGCQLHRNRKVIAEIATREKVKRAEKDLFSAPAGGVLCLVRSCPSVWKMTSREPPNWRSRSCMSRSPTPERPVDSNSFNFSLGMRARLSSISTSAIESAQASRTITELLPK